MGKAYSYDPRCLTGSQDGEPTARANPRPMIDSASSAILFTDLFSPWWVTRSANPPISEVIHGRDSTFRRTARHQGAAALVCYARRRPSVHLRHSRLR